MENYRLQPRDYMMIRITNAFVKGDRKNEKGEYMSSWRNFSGRPTNVNRKGGDRNIMLDLNRKGNKDLPFLIEFGNDRVGWRPVSVDDLIEMGWKISLYDAREEGRTVKDDYIPSANLKVNVYQHEPMRNSPYDPKVFEYVDGVQYQMVFFPDPSNQRQLPIDILDDEWFDRVQIRLTHGDTGTAYLESMHIYPRPRTTRTYDDWAR